MKRILARTLLVAMVSTSGVLAGLVPNLNVRSSLLDLSRAAYAQQDFTNEQVRNYAQSVREIEEIRQAAYSQIRNLSDSGEVPSVACHEPRTMRTLNQSIRDIVVDYCTQSIRIVERNNLTIMQFNTITTTQQEDSELAERIQEELLRLQTQPQNSSRPQTRPTSAR
jgi:hypothetical protein